jgi:hypothetical protein
VSAAGDRAAARKAAQEARRAAWVSRALEAAPRPLSAQARADLAALLSPDGKAAVTHLSPNANGQVTVLPAGKRPGQNASDVTGSTGIGGAV